jgi:hypothetical protein
MTFYTPIFINKYHFLIYITRYTPAYRRLSPGETNKIKRLLLAHGWITHIKKIIRIYEYTKEREYICCADNKSAGWGIESLRWLVNFVQLF